MRQALALEDDASTETPLLSPLISAHIKRSIEEETPGHAYAASHRSQAGMGRRNALGLISGLAASGAAAVKVLFDKGRREGQMEEVTRLLEQGYAEYTRQVRNALASDAPFDPQALIGMAFEGPLTQLLTQQGALIPELADSLERRRTTGQVYILEILKQLVSYYDHRGKYFAYPTSGVEINGQSVDRILDMLLYDKASLPPKSIPDQPVLHRPPLIMAVDNARIKPLKPALMPGRGAVAWSERRGEQRMIVVNLDQARAEAIDVWDRAQLYKDASDQQLSAEMALAAAENRPNDYFPRLAALLERAQYPELLHQSREQFVALAFPQIVRMHIAHEQAHVQAIEEGYISSELNETGQKVVGETFAGLGALLYGGMPYVAVEEIINWGAMMPGTAYGEAGANIINSLIIEFLNHRKDYPSIDFVVPSDLSNRQIAQFFMSQFPHLTEAKFLLAGGLIREAIIRALREKKLGLLQKRPRTHFAQSVLAAV